MKERGNIQMEVDGVRVAQLGARRAGSGEDFSLTLTTSSGDGQSE